MPFKKLGKAVTKVVKTVAPIAPIFIPFVAPWAATSIAGMIGASITTPLGMAAASAATGAVMGNVLADVNNTDRTRGGLLGAIGGGTAGYFTEPMPPPTSAGLTLPSNPGTSALTLPSGTPTPTLPSGTASAPTFTSYDPTAASAPLSLAGAQAVPNTTVSASTTPFLAGTTATTVSAANAATLPTAAATTAELTAGQRMLQGIKDAPGALMDKISDPKVVADITLKAAGTLLGAYVAGSGTSPEEQQLIQQQAEELRRLQETNMDLFRQRLEWAQTITGEARYFDPEYFGLQSARAAQNRGAAVMREQTRGLTGARREAEQRRGRLATARDVGTAFDTGYGQGAAGRLSALQVGLSMMPDQSPSSMADIRSLWSTYQDVDRRRTAQQENVGSFISDITSSILTQSRGDKEKEKEKENA